MASIRFEHISFDRAHIQLALTRPMLSNIGEPFLVYPIGSEVALHEVITQRRASLLVAAFALDSAS